MAKSDAAVDSLAQLAGSPGPLVPRLLAIELLGEIGTKAAREALVGLLRWEEKTLIVRGQLCIQLGSLRETTAVPVIAEWLDGIGPRSLHDVPGPKEAQPSTCYVRHVEALGMIGDGRAIPILERFAKKIPQGVGYGGFLSNIVTNGARGALDALKSQAAFWGAVRKHPGLEAKIAPLFEHFRSNPAARFRHHESHVVGRTAQGKAILGGLTAPSNPALARAAKELLDRYESLTP